MTVMFIIARVSNNDSITICQNRNEPLTRYLLKIIIFRCINKYIQIFILDSNLGMDFNVLTELINTIIY
jgi:hypothetical protein